MAKRSRNLSPNIPTFFEARRNVIKNKDDLEYCLKAVVRILSQGKGKNGYFIQEIEALFASELNEEVLHEKTFIDHENLKIIIKLPDPSNEQERELIRHAIVKDYTLGVDDLRTRAALIALNGMDELTRKVLIEHEKHRK